MKKATNTDKRIAHYLKQMKKEMPKVSKQVAVYEKAVKAGKLIKSPQPAPQYRHG